MKKRRIFNFNGSNTSEGMAISIIEQIRKGNHSLREDFISQYKPFVLRVTSIAMGELIISQDRLEFNIALAAFNEAIDTFNLKKHSGFFSFAEETIKKHIAEYIKQDSRKDEINLSNEKDSSLNEVVKDFSRVSNQKSDVKNFTRITDKKSSRSALIKNFSRITSVAASFAIVFIATQFWDMGKKTSGEFAYVDVDVNPSVEFVVNSDSLVTKTIFINEDAKKLFNGKEVKNISLSTAISDFIQKAKDGGYLSSESDQNTVLISGALNDDNDTYDKDKDSQEKKLDTMIDSLKKDVEEINNGDVQEKSVEISPDERKKALENKLSMGKYYLHLQLQEKGIDMSIDEIRNSNVSDILKKLETDDSLQSEVVATPTPVNSAEATSEPTVTPITELSIEGIAAYKESAVIVSVYNKDKKIESQGSGFCIAPGMFVTNHHVIEEGRSIKITTDDGTVLDVEGIVKDDAVRDLAVLKTVKNSGTKALKLGTNSSLKIGDKVVTIGSPEGLRNTVATGIISGFRKEGNIDVIQTTVPIAHGSSGSPLFDMYGNVVGINSYGITDYQLNFAIPADDLKPWQEELSNIPFEDVRVIRKLVTGDTNIDLKIVIYDILSALENEDIKTYFNSMTKDLYSKKTDDNLQILFKNYDLIYNLEDIKVLSRNNKKAVLQYVYTINKIKGEEFHDCRIEGKSTLTKVDGQWKISESSETVKYLK